MVNKTSGVSPILVVITSTLALTLIWFLVDPPNQKVKSQGGFTEEDENWIRSVTHGTGESGQGLYSIGERFEQGGFRYRILEASVGEVIGRRFNQEKVSEGAIFYLVKFEIENLQNKTDTVLASDFRIKDERGREFSPSSRAITVLALGGRHDLFMSQLQPGIKKKCLTVFELPMDSATRPLILVVPEKGLFSTGKIEVQLPRVQ